MVGYADRRSAIYGDRPRMIIANEILTNGLNIGLMRYGDACVPYPMENILQKLTHSTLGGAE